MKSILTTATTAAKSIISFILPFRIIIPDHTAFEVSGEVKEQKV